MSLVIRFRCVICTLHYRDLAMDVDRNQAENHIYSDHDYTEKLNAAKFVGLVSDDKKISGCRYCFFIEAVRYLPCSHIGISNPFINTFYFFFFIK